MFGKREKTAPQKESTTRAPRSGSGLKWLLLIFIVSTLVIGGGFVQFMSQIPTHEPKNKPVAEGVVVLTGAGGRIQKAVWLVSTTGAEKLLISGVNVSTKTSEIKELKNISPNFIDCCIALDYVAKNTIDNAHETHLWAKKHDIKTLLLVTSNYHMPRSLREMKMASPETKFIPYPVIDKKVQLENWWEYPGTRKLLIREYFKYILSITRFGLVKIGVKSSLLKTEQS